MIIYFWGYGYRSTPDTPPLVSLRLRRAPIANSAIRRTFATAYPSEYQAPRRLNAILVPINEDQFSTNGLSCFERVGCRNLRNAFASI